MKPRRYFLVLFGIVSLVSWQNIGAQEIDGMPRDDRASQQHSQPNQSRPLDIHIGDYSIETHQKRRFDKTFWSVWIPTFAVNAGDAATTSYCLHHGTCKEGNPFLGGRPSDLKIWSLKAGSVGLGFYVSHKLRRGRSRAWIAPAAVLLALGAAATINNAIVISDSGPSRAHSNSMFIALSPQPIQNTSACTLRSIPSLGCPSSTSDFRFAKSRQHGFALELHF